MEEGIGPRVPRSKGPKVQGSQGPRYLKLKFKYELDSKEGPSCFLFFLPCDLPSVQWQIINLCCKIFDVSADFLKCFTSWKVLKLIDFLLFNFLSSFVYLIFLTDKKLGYEIRIYFYIVSFIIFNRKFVLDNIISNIKIWQGRFLVHC